MPALHPRIKQLEDELNQANHDYYVKARPTMPDSDYDAKFNELKALSALHPEAVSPGSPIHRVGSDLTESFAKVKHTEPMLSLNNVFSPEEAANAFKYDYESPISLVIEPKIDGLAMSIKYVDGVLRSAVTRGDGTTGDDVTVNIKRVMSVPLTIPVRGTVEIRGEVCMPFKEFERLNSELVNDGDEPFSNPRNAAAGSMKLKDPSVVAKRGLLFIAYTLIGHPDGNNWQVNNLSLLDDMGFYTCNALQWIDRLDYNPAFPEQFTESLRGIVTARMHRRVDLPFAIDGLVIKISSIKIQQALGNGTRSPRWAWAYKFPAEQKATVVTGITVQVGRLGTLTPVAELKPVNLGGVIVKRATLHNYDEIKRLGVNVGDSVIVQRAAEVIPQVVRVETKNSDGVWEFATHCPCCGTPVHYTPGQVAITCPNTEHCSDQVFARLEHAVKKASLDIDGCGEKTIRALMGLGVSRLSHMYALTPEVVEPVIGKSACKKLFKGMEAAKTAPLWRKIHAFGIDNIGTTNSKELVRKWPSLADMMDAPIDQLQHVVGPAAGRNLQDFLTSEANINELLALSHAGLVFEDAVATGPLVGKTFCITGGLNSGTRDEVAARIEQAGGRFSGSVSRKVTHLVVGDGAGKGKTDGAKKHGTQCITEAELYAMMGREMPTVSIDTAADY